MTLTLADLVFVTIIGGIAWYVFSGMRVRELAIQAARRSTEMSDLQLLDQSVSSGRVSLSRDTDGHWRIWRQYRFEYSRDGINREKGQIIMLGQRLQAVVVSEPPTIH